MNPVPLLSIDTKTKVCRRYVDGRETHGFLMDAAAITPELVEAMRLYPDAVAYEEVA